MTTPLSLYAHIPWCVRKCPYCDFNSHQLAGALPEDEYVEALLADLAADVEHFGIQADIHTVFIGGGTPSLLSPRAVGRLLAGADRVLSFSPGVEITLETNPGTVQEGERFKGFRTAGVNRLSIGVQSFNDRHLSALGRIHDAACAKAAYRSAREAGFDNINLDLMHGLPGQDVAAALADLQIASSLAPEHISWYQLTIEPNTVFHKRPPGLPGEDTLWAIYEAGMDLLASHGYTRYEVSAFARADRACAHNLNYWQFGDYLGVGAGSHGKLDLGDHRVRTTKTRIPRDYLEHPNRRITPIDRSELAVEFLMNGLRLCAGFGKSLFEERTGLERSVLDRFLARSAEKQLIESSDQLIRPTQLGMRFLDTLLAMAMDDRLIARRK